MAETATAPPVTKFAAELEKAFASATPEGEPPAAPADTPPPKPEPKKEPAKEPKEPPAEAPKTGTPKDLFRKSEKAKDEPPAEPKSDVDTIAPPDFKGDSKAKAGWDALKGKAKEFEGLAKTREDRAKELEAKLAEYEPLKAQLAERDKKLQEYDGIVARARLEDHPEFRREFIDGRERLVNRAKEIITDSDGDPKSIETALSLKGKARVEALSKVAEELNQFQSGRLGRVIDELTDLDERAEAKRAEAKQSYEKLKETERQRESETASKRLESRGREFDDTVRRLRTELEVLQKADGFDGWNARGDKIVKDSKEYVDAHPDADIEAEILSRTVAAYRDDFLKADRQNEEKDKKIAELEKELKAVHSKSPSLAARGNGQSTGDTSRPFMAALKSTIGEE